MTTVAQIIEDTKDHLLGSTREQTNTLAAAYTAGATQLAFTYPLGGIAAGQWLAVDLELFYVYDVNAASKTAVVVGAQRGSTPAAHAMGAQVQVRPNFAPHMILRQVNNELAALSSPLNGLFKVGTADITANPLVRGYALPAAAQDVLEVRRDTSSGGNEWPLVRGFRILRGMPTGDFSTGAGIRFDEELEPGLTVRVRYKTAFTALTAVGEDVLNVSGLPDTAHDILPIGAAIRMMAGREISRNLTSAQPDTRRAEEVPPGAVGGAPRALAMLRAQRIQEEAARLQAQWPTGGF